MERMSQISTAPIVQPQQADMPQTHLKVLIISGDSHVFAFDPDMTVGRAKELIWNMWPSEWSEPAQPPAPSYLRMIHSGRVLGDEATLAASGLPVDNGAAPQIVHLSVRSFSIKQDRDGGKEKSAKKSSDVDRREEREEQVPKCSCTIM